MTLLFEAAPEPALPPWQRHSADLDDPREQLDYLTYLRLDICPYCWEDVGSVFCGHDIHIDTKGRDGG